MKPDCPGRLPGIGWRWLAVVLVSFVLISGCAQQQQLQQTAPPRSERHEALAYYQMLGRLTASELARERSALAAQSPTPAIQIRQAMLLGYQRPGQETGRALALLDGLLKSTDPIAIELQPLTRLLADHYGERLRLEAQLDRQGGQLKDNQRKAQELQEKLDSLTDIERTLTPRSGKGGRR